MPPCPVDLYTFVSTHIYIYTIQTVFQYVRWSWNSPTVTDVHPRFHVPHVLAIGSSFSLCDWMELLLIFCKNLKIFSRSLNCFLALLLLPCSHLRLFCVQDVRVRSGLDVLVLRNSWLSRGGCPSQEATPHGPAPAKTQLKALKRISKRF